METVTFYDRYDVGVIRLPVAYYECLWDAANKNSIVILLCRNFVAYMYFAITHGFALQDFRFSD